LGNERPASASTLLRERNVSILPLDITWTYGQHGDRLQLKRIATELGLLLIERRTGAPDRSYFFADLRDLIRFQTSLATRFEQAGWSLLEFAPARDARKRPRTAQRRRPARVRTA
jgi:hypothetical protein